MENLAKAITLVILILKIQRSANKVFFKISLSLLKWTQILSEMLASKNKLLYDGLAFHGRLACMATMKETTIQLSD